ncbi:Crp/Fnr family transcriptional regulator [Mangrovibrevibacter kandeliae]|uniref:Crp/Fnr family transcriptional regulator n=1 Tax=Mangrovibrevibacter kandeliae TaxID=2968473 RepID=UPI0021176203|nr:Crp/Fnr family transcriptional regulator [Aurantimonas sp. CSK15Z-1]MCQ8781958.1 Crp/Fnr family transcriptional regulator [Aurantimonas sp. CSK15Z-1]
MSLESDIAVLREVPLLADLTPDQLRLLAFGAEHRRLREGETLFRAEARADAGFVIASGRIALLRGKPGAQDVVGRYGPGALLGELALLTETRRPATAVSETDCEVIRITRPIFRRMLEEYPEIAADIHERLSARLVQMTAEITALEGRFGGGE